MPSRSPSAFAFAVVGTPARWRPLLVFGPRSLDYDFGPTHPLSPRRFGPGMELLPAMAPNPARPEAALDEELAWLTGLRT